MTPPRTFTPRYRWLPLEQMTPCTVVGFYPHTDAPRTNYWLPVHDSPQIVQMSHCISVHIASQARLFSRATLKKLGVAWPGLRGYVHINKKYMTLLIQCLTIYSCIYLATCIHKLSHKTKMHVQLSKVGMQIEQDWGYMYESRLW